MTLDHPGVRTFALFLLRVSIGLIFFAHGWQKLFDLGIPAVANQFAALGIPQPSLSATVVGILELVCGLLLIVGLLTPIAAGLLTLDMLVALYTAHFNSAFFVQDGGFEFVLLLIAACVMLIAFGGGKASLDSVLLKRNRT